MRGELKRLHSPDVQDLATWAPGNAEFTILLQIIAGPEGGEGEESFDVTLCSSAWVNKQAEKEGVISGRFLLIVAQYNYKQISQYVSNYLERCVGTTWPEVAVQVARLGQWEFEDYQE